MTQTKRRAGRRSAGGSNEPSDEGGRSGVLEHLLVHATGRVPVEKRAWAVLTALAQGVRGEAFHPLPMLRPLPSRNNRPKITCLLRREALAAQERLEWGKVAPLSKLRHALTFGNLAPQPMLDDAAKP